MSGTPKLPEDSFAFYVAMGADRSYEEVARHFDVHKRTVARAAQREKWTERLAAIEEKTRQLTDAKLADTLHERDLRHRKIILAMAGRAAQALQSHELTSCMEAAKVADMAIKLERLIAGQPSEATTISIERVTKNELSRFLTDEEDDDWGEQGEVTDLASSDAAPDETAEAE